MFEAAREAGMVTELDWACRAAAARGALDAGMRRPMRLFVNAAADAVQADPPAEVHEVLRRSRREFDIVVEITEQSIAARPADMLRRVDAIRALDVSIALDDVGADASSLALMPFISPEVIKLDLRLVQGHPSVEIAEIANAVVAEAERSRAVIVAEGIEQPEHVEIARALGADYGQGWLYGRPSGELELTPTAGMRIGPHRLLSPNDRRTPFEIVSGERELRRGDKSLLLTISRQLERQAAQQGAATVVLATFQDARHFTTATARRYEEMAARSAFVEALACNLGDEPAPRVRGGRIADGHPLSREWTVTVTSPHFAAAFTARDLGDDGPDMGRRFDFAVTYDRDLAVQSARALMREIAPGS